ncbi:MAG: acetate--CoA ligase family protein [Ignavibacteria bacterium]|nr:acetate--CoA ligase family protein [Ignavibacteria bacterium]
MFHKFFYSESICIPGASTKEKSIGYELLKTIKSYGYTGKIFPVNPNASEVLGYACYQSIQSITEKIDLAIVVVPKKFVVSTIEDLLAKDVKAIVLITAGFKETGEEGRKAEEYLLSLVHKAGARMVGPNCMGIINSMPEIMLNATFVAEHPKESSAAFLSQSGALGAAVLNSLRETEISFGHFISVGNKADVNENDLLTYWQNDEKITAISMYLESFVDGEQLIRSLTGGLSKPLIIVKAGKTAAGMKAASSHTGALGSSDRVVDAVMRQFGIIRAVTIEEMFNTIKGIERFPLPAGRRIGVVTNAGGPAILCVDALEKAGLQLAVLQEKTKDALKEFVHAEGSVHNPVDLLPGGNDEQYRRAVEELLADDAVDAVVSIFVEPVMVSPMPVVEGINGIVSKKPVYQVVLPLPEFWERYRNESETRKPLFRRVEDPADIIANLCTLREKKESVKSASRLQPGKPRYDFVQMPVQDNAFWLSEDETRHLCKAYELPLIAAQVVTPDTISAFVPVEGYPVVLKGLVSGVTHKSDLQLVSVNIPVHSALMAEAGAMNDRLRAKQYNIDGYLIQPYLEPRFEVLIGGFRDPSFGPMIMFGTGGKYVEVFNDTAIRSAYATLEDVREMVEETRMGTLLHGVRGEQGVDLENIYRILLSAAQMILDNEKITEFDMNPLIVAKNGRMSCVDIRIKMSK